MDRLLARLRPCGSAVQVYRDVVAFADSVTKYLAVGFDLGEPALVIATPEHAAIFEERLAESGWDAARIEQHGLLSCADADATLAASMDGDRPSAEQFEAVVGGPMDRVVRGSPTAASVHSARWSTCSASAGIRAGQPTWRSSGTASRGAGRSRS